MTQTPTPVYVVTTYNKLTLETDTAGAFTVLTAAKREAQRATGQLIDAGPEAIDNFTVPIEEWHGSEFVAQHYMRGYAASPDADAAIHYEWWVQPASGAPYRDGDLIPDDE